MLSRERGFHLIFEAFLLFLMFLHGNRGLKAFMWGFLLCSKLLLLCSNLGFRKLRAFIFVRRQGASKPLASMQAISILVHPTWGCAFYACFFFYKGLSICMGRKLKVLSFRCFRVGRSFFLTQYEMSGSCDPVLIVEATGLSAITWGQASFASSHLVPFEIFCFILYFYFI